MAPQILNQMLHPSRSEAKAMRRLKAWGNGFDDTLTTFRGRIVPRQSDHLRYNRTREYWVLPAGSWEVMMIKAKLKRPKPRRGGGGRPQLFIKRKRKYVPDKKWFERMAEDQRRDMLKPVAERVQRAHLYHVLDNNVRSNITPCVELGRTFFPWTRLPADIQDAIIAFAWDQPDELRLDWLVDEKRFQARRPLPLHHGENHDANVHHHHSRRHPHRQLRSNDTALPPTVPLSTLLSVNRAFSARVLHTLHGLTTLHFTSAADLFRFLETLHASYLPLLGRLALTTTDLDAFEALTPRHAVASRGLRSMMLNSGVDEGMECDDCCGGGEKHGHRHGKDHRHGHHRAPHRGSSLQRVDEDDDEGSRHRHRRGGGGRGHAHHKRDIRSIGSSSSSSSSSVDEDCCSDGCCGHDVGHDGHDNHATDTSSSFFFAESESSPRKRRGGGRQKKRQTARGAATADKGHAHHGGGHQHGRGCCGDDHGPGHDGNHAAARHSGFSIDDDDTTEETQWWRRRGRQLPEWLRRWSKRNKTLLRGCWTKGKRALPRLYGGRKKKGGDGHHHKHDHSHHKDKRQEVEEEEEERRRSLRDGSATLPRDVLTGLKSFVLRVEGGEGGGEGRRHFKWMRAEDERAGCRPSSSRELHQGSADHGGRVVCHIRGEYGSKAGLRAVWGADWLVRALRETMAPRLCEVRIEGLLPDGEAVVDGAASRLVVTEGGRRQQGSKKGKECAIEAAVPPQEEGPVRGLILFDSVPHEEFSGDEDWQSAVSSLNLVKPVERSMVVRKTRKQTRTYLEKQVGGAQDIPWTDLMLPNDYKRKFRLEFL